MYNVNKVKRDKNYFHLCLLRGISNSMVRRSKEDAEKTKQDILDAAVYHFSEEGFAKATLENIAKTANVTRGAVYWHFKNKVEIFDALHEQIHHSFLEMILEDIKFDHPKPLKQLEELCVHVFLDLEKNEQKKRILQLFLIKCDYSGDLAPLQEIHLQKKKECAGLFEQYFKKAIERDQLHTEFSPTLLTTALSAYIKGILYEYLIELDNYKLKDKISLLMAFFFKNLS